MNLQKAQYNSVKRVINYCYEFSFFQTKQINSGDLCIVAEPVVEYKTKDPGKISESVNIDKRNNDSTPTIKNVH